MLLPSIFMTGAIRNFSVVLCIDDVAYFIRLLSPLSITPVVLVGHILHLPL